MSKATFRIEDRDNLISASIRAGIERCALYVIELLDRYIDWAGTLDVVVRIRPASELTWSSADGLLPSLGQIAWDGRSWVNQTLSEMLTGVDANPLAPDAGCTIYLSKTGAITNYGRPVWFDPNPRFDTDPGLPAGMHDFVGIFTHELVHCIGLYGVTREWKSLVEFTGGNYFFTGPRTQELLGAPLMLAEAYSADNYPDHYGKLESPLNNITRGLMFQYGNYERNRLDIGRLDLSLLEDLGLTIHNRDGLPLVDLQDNAPNLAGTPSAERLFGDYHANSIRGGAGADTLDGGMGADSLLGEDGRDVLIGAGDSDVLDGGAGTDFARYAHARAAAQLGRSGDGSLTLTGPDGTDTLRNLERLTFTDGSVALDLGLQQPAGQAVLLIGAVLGREQLPLKKELMAVVIDLFDQGYTLPVLAGALMRLPIWGGVLSATDRSADIAAYLLQRVYGRAPTAGEIASAVQIIDGQAQGQFLAELAMTAANQAQVNLTGLQLTGFEFGAFDPGR